MSKNLKKKKDLIQRKRLKDTNLIMSLREKRDGISTGFEKKKQKKRKKRKKNFLLAFSKLKNLKKIIKRNKKIIN